MAMTNFGTNDPLGVKLWSRLLQPLVLPPGCCSVRGYTPCTQHGAIMGPNEVHMIRLAHPLPEAARIAGVGHTRIFEAVRKQKLTKIELVRERTK